MMGDAPTMQGWLFKYEGLWTGYQKRWFILHNGHLSYYKTEADVGHTCKGTMSLRGALIYTEDGRAFVVSNEGQEYHIRTLSKEDRKAWMAALEQAKSAKNTRSKGEEKTEGDSHSPLEWSNATRRLQIQLNELQICNDLAKKHWNALAEPLNDIQSNAADPETIRNKSKEIVEGATLFRMTTNAMIDACAECLKTAQDMAETLTEQHKSAGKEVTKISNNK